MALQASGLIRFSDISNEFGNSKIITGKTNLGAYRVSQTVGDLTRPLDDDIPTSGTIRFSDFYGKKLNVVVNYTSSTKITRVDARSDYNANNSRIVVIGNFRSRPTSSSNKKIWIHINGTISSDANTADPPNRTYCSLLTGSWNSNTELILDISSNGIVMGSGGNGGKGGDVSTSGYGSGRGADLTAGQPGKNGTSAIGIQYTPIVLRNRGGFIISGHGGGGGGGAGYGNDKDRNLFGIIGRQTAAASGSGGGGGRGLPAGKGGSAGDAGPSLGGGRYVTTVVAGNSGSDGTILSGGRGGDSSSLIGNYAAAGGAGGGGSPNGEAGTSSSDGTNATDGNVVEGGTGGNGYGQQDDGAGFGTTSGDVGGQGGYAIIANASSSQVDIQNTGVIIGVKIYNSSPT